MANSSTAQQIARSLADLARRITSVERAARLPRSSIDAGSLAVTDGGAIRVMDNRGSEVVTIGDIGDGNYGIASANGGLVVASDVLDGIVSELALAEEAVTEAKLAASAVTETKIADNSISSPKVIAGAIQTGHIAAGAVAAGKIAAGTVTATELAALSVTAGKIAANAVTAGTIAAGSIGTDRLTVGAAGTLVATVSDAGGDLGEWQVTSGSAVVATVTDAQTGGSVYRLSGSTVMMRTPIIPFDPQALYRISFRVRQVTAPTAGAANFFAGFAGVGTDGVAFVNTSGANSTSSQHWIAANSVPLSVSTAWTEYTGYVQGTAASGTGVASPNPNSPGKMHANVRYLRPRILANSSATGGVTEIDHVTVEVLHPGSVAAVTIADGSIVATKISAGAIDGQTIKSPGFTTGVTGWQIASDGSAEFNNAKMRGSLQVGSGYPYRIDGGPIPSEIQFDPDGFAMVAIVNRIVMNANLEIVHCYSDVSGGLTPSLVLWEVTIDRTATPVVVWRSKQVLNAVEIGADNAASVAAGVATVFNYSTLYIGNWQTTGGSHSPAKAPFLIDNISAPRGMRLRTDTTANSAAIGAEAALLTTPNTSPSSLRKFWDGRAYEIRWKTRLLGSVANTSTVRVRRQNAVVTSGQLLGDWQFATGTVAENYAGRVTVRRAPGAGDLLSQISLTLQASAGTTTSQASTTSVCDLEVWDIGDAADYPNAIAIV